jgi:hypothetical protein
MTGIRLSDKELSGMTVNERLFTCSLLDAWDEAARERDRSQMITILIQVAIESDQAEKITDAVLKKQKMYGF